MYLLLKSPFWHVQLEMLLGNSMEQLSPPVNNYNNLCPVCNREIKEMIMPVKRIGLSKILADTFINNLTGVLTPDMLIKKLSTYLSVGQVIYNKNCSVKCPPSKFISSTVLQLFSCGLVRMDTDNKSIFVLCLVIHHLSPSYLDNIIWFIF